MHIPFCFHKCHYCDFYSIVDNRDRQEAFTDRLIAELAAVGPLLVGPLETLFVGGGTPSLLRVDLWQRLLHAIHENLPLAAEIEFTVEANPETVTPELAEVLCGGGVNRVSIGAQSFDPKHLKSLERWHDPVNVGRAVQTFRGAGIGSVNADLIFGIPGQALSEWREDLRALIELGVDHASCYGLTYEPSTALTKKMQAGRIAPIDEDLEASMYELTMDELRAAGFEHYELSNWARPGHRCRHNMLYWNNANWWAFGPSASGHVNGVRFKNVARLQEYLDAGPMPTLEHAECVDDDARIGEQLMLGLRLMEGIERSRADELLRVGLRAGSRCEAIRRFTVQGLLEDDANGLRLTHRGIMLADSVMGELL